MRSAPRLSPRLLRAIVRLDDGKMPLAELNRRVGREAERLGLPRPSYERVRELAQEARRRRRRRGPSTAEVIVDIAFRARPPEALLDRLSGIGVPDLDRSRRRK